MRIDSGPKEVEILEAWRCEKAQRRTPRTSYRVVDLHARNLAYTLKALSGIIEHRYWQQERGFLV
jgi:hypothetical protein